MLQAACSRKKVTWGPIIDKLLTDYRITPEKNRYSIGLTAELNEKSTITVHVAHRPSPGREQVDIFSQPDSRSAFLQFAVSLAFQEPNLSFQRTHFEGKGIAPKPAKGCAIRVFS